MMRKRNTIFFSLIYKATLYILSVFGSFPSQAQDSSSSSGTESSQYYQKAEWFARKEQFDSAIYYMEEAADISYRQSNWRDYVSCKMNVAYYYYYQDDFIQIENILSKVHPIARKRLPEHYQTHASIYQYYGAIYREDGRYYKALEAAREALRLRKKIPDSNELEIADECNNIGVMYDDIGDYDKAIQYHKQALNIRIKHLAAHDLKLDESYNNIAMAWQNKEDYKQALYYYKKNWDVLKYYRPGELPNEYMGFYNNLALVHVGLNQADSAFFYLQKAQQLVPISNEELVLKTYNNLVYAHKESGNYDEAIRYFGETYEKAVSWYDSVHPELADLLYDIGETHFLWGHYEQALRYYQQAITKLVTNFSDTSIFASPILRSEADGSADRNHLQYIRSTVRLLKVLELKTQALEAFIQQKDLTATHRQYLLNTYQAAIDLIDLMRWEYSTATIRELLNRKAMRIYEGAINTAAHLYQYSGESHYIAQAFTFSEKSKAFLLEQNLQTTTAEKMGRIPDSILQKERALKMDISLHEKSLYELKEGTSEAQNINEKLLTLRIDYEQLIEQLEQKYPRYYELKYDLRATPVAQLQTQLDKKTALVEYFTGTEQLFIFYIDRKCIQLAVVPTDSNFEQEVYHFHKDLSNYTYSSQHDKASCNDYHTQAYTLYQGLFPEAIQSLLRRKKTLLIIRDGLLHYIPFESLLYKTAETNNNNYRKLPYLIRRHAISYAYSAKLLFRPSSPSTAPYTYLGVAPTYPDTLSIPPSCSNSGPLIRNREEIQKGQELFGGTTYMDTKATKQRFKNTAHQYRILHLAMHAVVNDVHPMYSHLIFDTQGDTIGDACLNTYELYHMELNADMAVLSACNTGTGKLIRGEGVISLARAFRYSGCPSTVMSLWAANDQMALKLIPYFFEELRKGKAKNEALRKAKIRFLEEVDATTAHPAFWSNFVLSGDYSPVYQKKTNSRSLWLIGLLAGSVFLAIFRIQKRRKEKRNTI